MREDLTVRWGELKTPLADRVECLSALLDAAPAAPEMVSRYEAIVEKLSARQPIAQVHTFCNKQMLLLTLIYIILFFCVCSWPTGNSL